VTEQYFEEEEFTTQFTGKTSLRIVQLTKPHWKWVLGFVLMITLVSVLDSYFTFLSALIIDEAILGDDIEALKNIVIRYGLLIIIQAAGVFGFIYLAGILGERIRYDMRRTLFNHLQELSLSYYDRTPIGWIISRVRLSSQKL